MPRDLYQMLNTREDPRHTKPWCEQAKSSQAESGSDFWIKCVGIRDESPGGRHILGASVVKVMGGRLHKILQGDISFPWHGLPGGGQTSPKPFTHGATDTTISQTSPEILLARPFLSSYTIPSHPRTTATEKGVTGPSAVLPTTRTPRKKWEPPGFFQLVNFRHSMKAPWAPGS